MKRIVNISIVLFWLVMVGLLVQRTFTSHSTSQTTIALLPETVEPILKSQEKWMGIYHHDQKVGYLHRQLIPTASGYQWTEQWRMKLQVMGTSQMVQTDVQANTDQHYALKDFSFRLRSSGTEFQVAGRVNVAEQTDPNGSLPTHA